MFEQISRNDFGDFFTSLGYYVQDKAVLSSLKAQYPQLLEISRAIVDSEQREASLAPYPAITELTALQAAIFDNWPDGRPTKNIRYAVVVEAWTAPAENIQTHKKADYQAKATFQLLSPKAMALKLKKVTGLPRDFIDRFKAIVADLEPHVLVGLGLTKRPGEGSKYHPVVLCMEHGVDGERTSAMLIDSSSALVLNKFSTTQPDGTTGHGGNVILQSRCDLSDFSTKWATDKWEE